MNNVARMKDLFRKLKSGTYHMATLIISSKKYRKYPELSLDWVTCIIKLVLFGIVSQ